MNKDIVMFGPDYVPSVEDSIDEEKNAEKVGQWDLVTPSFIRISNCDLSIDSIGVSAIQGSISGFVCDQQKEQDSLISTYFDIVTQNRLFEKIQEYEDENKIRSDEFYERWTRGAMPKDSENYDWARFHRNLFGNSELKNED